MEADGFVMIEILGNNVYSISEYDFNFDNESISDRKGTKFYNREFFTFDIETTALKEIEQSFMYIWQVYDGQSVIIGRTWTEFKYFIKTVSQKVYPAKLVIYVHYLSHEFQYLSGIYDFKKEEVFATDKRKVLKCEMLDNIEFRCSWFLSNMSLGEYTKKMKVAHVKLEGELDYSVRRFSDTELNLTSELPYCVNDVVGLHEAIRTEMDMGHDNIITIPLTSTGYIRRDVRNVMYKYRNTLIKKIFPSYEVYEMLRQAFRGGDTHANRYYTGQILHNVKSIDRSSSYPDVMINDRYPMSKFKILQGPYKNINDYINEERACLFVAVFEQLQLKDDLEGSPYISYDKTRGTCGEKLDNGRILYAELTEMTITDLDYKIIREQYTWNEDTFTIKKLAVANYGDLPQEIKDVLIKYYIRKTELKDVKGKETYYHKSKNVLNAGYGMMAQCPVKEDILYIGGEFMEDDEDEQIILEEYRKNAFLVYQWGVWTTCWARTKLHIGRKMVGHNFVYCDTDSVKYVEDINSNELAQFNTDSMARSEQTNALAYDVNKKLHYMGVYEDDGKYKRFVTFGAKKYAYEDADGKLHITIAGVNKKLGAEELEEIGGLDALKIGLVFKKGGGHEFVYNDKTFGWYETDGHKVYITKNLYSRESTYTLGYGKDYAKLIAEEQYKLKHHRFGG